MMGFAALNPSYICCDKELKPEAIAVISDTSDSLGVVILSDGMCDGGPLTFVIRR